MNLNSLNTPNLKGEDKEKFKTLLLALISKDSASRQLSIQSQLEFAKTHNLSIEGYESVRSDGDTEYELRITEKYPEIVHFYYWEVKSRKK